MFDIGFWELVALAVIALLIVGPEQLPKVARDTGRLVAKVRHFIQNTRRELEKELNLDEHGDLQKSIDKVEKLMHEAPDRLLSEQGDRKDDKPGQP